MIRHWGPVCCRASPAFALAGLLALVACSRPPEAQPARPEASGWYEFEGSWNASGSRRFLALGSGRRASVAELRGSLFLSGPSRPGVGFRGEAITLSDSATGMIGRAVWTDERGDQVFSELRGEGTATGNRIRGSFIGGTGRYAGASGAYDFSWKYVLEAEDGTVQGRAVGLSGRVRFERPKVPGTSAGAKP